MYTKEDAVPPEEGKESSCCSENVPRLEDDADAVGEELPTVDVHDPRKECSDIGSKRHDIGG